MVKVITEYPEALACWNQICEESTTSTTSETVHDQMLTSKMRCQQTKPGSRRLQMMRNPPTTPLRKKLRLHGHSLFSSAILTIHFKVHPSMLESPKLIICTIKGCTTSATVSALIPFLYWRFEHRRLPEPDENVMGEIPLKHFSRQFNIPELQHNHIHCTCEHLRWGWGF